MRGIFTDSLCLLPAFFLTVVVRKIWSTTDIVRPCVSATEGTSPCSAFPAFLSPVAKEKKAMPGMKDQSPILVIPGTRYMSRQQRDGMPGPPTVGSEAEHPILLRPTPAGALFCLHSREEVTCLSP